MAFPREERGSARCVINQFRISSTTGFDCFARGAEAIARFEADYEAKYPKAVASLRRDEEQLLTFFGFPAEHRLHLRTGNVIESPFATVRLASG